MAYTIGQKYLFGSGDDQGTATYVGEYNGQPVWSDAWGRLRVGDPQGGQEVVRNADGSFSPMPAGSSYGDQGIIDYWAANPAPAGSSSTPTTSTTSSSLYAGAEPATIDSGTSASGKIWNPLTNSWIDIPEGSNLPSEGPNLSTVFGAEYYNVNANVDEQYAQWRDARRAAGEDPYDMAAFRAHLVRIGAPDPGAPRTGVTPLPTVTDDPTPTPTTPQPTWTPPPAAEPASPPPAQAPPPGMAPGYSFNPQARAGTAQQLLGNFQMPNIPNEDDVRRLFPFVGSDGVAADPRTAAANLMEQAGFNLRQGNPFTSFMQANIPEKANIARLQSILSGQAGNATDIAAAAPRFMGGGITASTGEGLIPQLRSLAQQWQSGGTGMTTAQQALAKSLESPEAVLSLIGNLRNLAPDLASAQQAVNQDLLRRYSNTAGSTTGSSIWDFIRY